MKKSDLKGLGDHFQNILSELPSDFPFTQWYAAALDIIDCKTFKKPQPKLRRSLPDNIIHINFKNKGIEMVNLTSILQSAEVKETLPSTAKTFSPPTIVYSLDNPISTKIFNFNKFTASLDVDEFLRNPNSLPCSCEHSPFSDNHHKHIISGNLALVENDRLRNLFAKGPKYRESKGIDWNQVESSILKGVGDCASEWSRKHKRNQKVLQAWVTTVTSKVKDKIAWLRKNKPGHRGTEVLKDQLCQEELKKLHNKYVITPIDKAAGNVTFICKRFYATVLIKELGLDGTVGNATYKSVINKTEKDIVDSHFNDLSNKLKIDTPIDNNILPHIYWIPKLHKNPTKFRFIIAAPKCSIKILSKAITKIFRTFYHQIEHYNKKSSYYSSVKSFWVIQNNEEVIKNIKKINKRKSARTISTFDFSTLYTKIPHDKLIDVMNELVDFCFQGGSHEQLSISKSGARWVTRKCRTGLRFDKKVTKDAIQYLMDNCYFTLGNKIFKQVIGIPMGSDPAPFMANLFLYHYESKWLKKLKKENLQKARKFSNTFRFIDDLLTINDDQEFLQAMNDIYPEELQLNLEHSGNNVSFLDLSITKCDRQLTLIKKMISRFLCSYALCL